MCYRIDDVLSHSFGAHLFQGLEFVGVLGRFSGGAGGSPEPPDPPRPVSGGSAPRTPEEFRKSIRKSSLRNPGAFFQSSHWTAEAHRQMEEVRAMQTLAQKGLAQALS